MAGSLIAPRDGLKNGVNIRVFQISNIRVSQISFRQPKGGKYQPSTLKFPEVMGSDPWVIWTISVIGKLPRRISLSLFREISRGHILVTSAYITIKIAEMLETFKIGDSEQIFL